MKNTSLIFFPFLKTSKSFKIRGLEFYSTDDLSSFNLVQKKQIKKIKKLFYLRDNYQIDKMCFCYVETDPTTNEDIILKELIIEIQQILGYIYSSPHPTLLETFLNYECATYYHVTPKKVSYFLVSQEFNTIKQHKSKKEISKNERYEVDGYLIEVNENISISAIDGCKIYPSPPQIVFNIHQDIYFDINQFIKTYPIFEYIFQGKTDRNSIVINKIFNSLKWYNKSNSILCDPNEAILRLAIAFETLLDLPNEPKLKERFKDAVKVLVGPINNLELWITQFYEARSEIVHSGTTSKYRISFEKGNIYHSLSAYGSIIFRVCLFAIIAGAEMAKRANLTSLLKTNRQRFDDICRLLNKKNSDQKEIINQVNLEIFDLENYRFVYEENLDIKMMICCVKNYSKKILEADIIKPNNIKNIFEDLQKINGSDKDFEYLDKFREIEEYLEKHINELDKDEGYWRSFKSLVDTVWYYTFRNYFYLKKEKQRI